MVRSRSLALCFLITRMFMLLLICINSTKAAMGYYLLLGMLLLCFLHLSINTKIHNRFSDTTHKSQNHQNHLGSSKFE